MNVNITLQLLESITHSDIIKDFLIREGLCDQQNQRFFCERAGIFSVRQQGRKMFLHNEIRVSKKDHMFYSIQIGNRDRQYGRQSLCLTDNFLPLRVFFFYSLRQKDEKYRNTFYRWQ